MRHVTGHSGPAFAVSSFSEEELLCALSGRRSEKSAHQVLGNLGSLVRLVLAGPDELFAAGLLPREVQRILASLELLRRATRGTEERPVLDEPGKVHELLSPRLVPLDHECMVLLCLDSENRLFHEEVFSIGSRWQTLVDPARVFGVALRHSARFVIVAHNHPSGDPTPSREDEEVTRRLAEVGDLLEMPLLDHVVIAAEGFRSTAYATGRARWHRTKQGRIVA